MAPGKTCGYVLVPVAEDDGAGSAYATAVEVIRAYAEQDEELREALATITRDAAAFGRPLRVAEWPEALRRVVEVPDLPMEQVLAEEMVGTVARDLTDSWEVRFGQLCAYRPRGPLPRASGL